MQERKDRNGDPVRISESAAVNTALGALHAQRGPLVVAQLGQSLDGRIATETGHSRYINGTAALDHLHGLRAWADAVVVGVGTVIADDPQLTVRRVAGASPVRIIIDSKGRTPAGARCLTDGAVETHVLGAVAPASGAHIAVPLDNGELTPAAIVAALAARGWRKLLIEGGANTISRFIAAGALDRLHVLLTPIILGSGRPGLTLPVIATVDEALRPATTVHMLGGGDVLFDCDFRRKAA